MITLKGKLRVLRIALWGLPQALGRLEWHFILAFGHMMAGESNAFYREMLVSIPILFEKLRM